MKISNQFLLALCIPLFLFTACTKQTIDDQTLLIEGFTEEEIFQIIDEDLNEILPISEDNFNTNNVENRTAIQLGFEGQLDLEVRPWVNRFGVVVGAILRDRGTAMDYNGDQVNFGCSARVHFKSGKVFAGHSFQNPGIYYVRLRLQDSGQVAMANPDLQNILSGLMTSTITRGLLAGQTGFGQRIATIDQQINELEDLLGLINVTASFEVQTDLTI